MYINGCCSQLACIVSELPIQYVVLDFGSGRSGIWPFYGSPAVSGSSQIFLLDLLDAIPAALHSVNG